ncbi:MAG: carbohydrate binding domain-containing protein [Dehalococcoidia bacterium]|nr:carbohydrate binding domain-containing protein [Dehalococcoidia bacterium]
MPGQWCANNYCYKPQLTTQGTTDYQAFSQSMDLVDARLGQLDAWKLLVDAHNARIICLGDSGYSTLSAALTTIGSNKATLVIPAGTVSVTSNITVPANVHLLVLNGGTFSISSGVTLTINGPLTAGPYQIFSWSGTGTVAGSPAVVEALPEWFGAKGDGSTDDYAALEKCLAVAQVWRVPVRFRPATYKLNTKLSPIDISKTRLLGTPGTKFDFSGLTTSGIDQFAIQLYSTVDYTGAINNRVAAMADIMMVGATAPANKKNHVGLCIGHTTYTRNSQFMVERVVIQGFKYLIRLLQNAWLLTFNDCMVRWGAMYVGTGLANMGSQLLFQNCFFESGDGEITELGTGNYRFEHCYFDNHWVKITGDVKAHFQCCTWENSGSGTTSGYWLEVTSSAASAMVLMDKNMIYFNNPGADYTTALFKIADSCVDRGWHINDLFLPNPWSYYKPEVTELRRTLVAGKGRVTHSGISAWQSGGKIPPIAYSSNAIYNAGFEAGSLSGWTTGGTGTVAVDSTDKKVGNYSCKLTSNAGQSCWLLQEFRVRPGQMVLGTFWFKFSVGTGNAAVSLAYYNEGGTVVTTDEHIGDQSDWRQYTSGTGGQWMIDQIRSFVPKGAVKCRLEVSCSSTSGSTVLQVDDFIINLV